MFSRLARPCIIAFLKMWPEKFCILILARLTHTQHSMDNNTNHKAPCTNVSYKQMNTYLLALESYI